MILITSSQSSCSAASTVELHSNWSITVYRLRCGVTVAPPFSQSTSSGRTASPSQHVYTAVGLLPSLARRPGTLSWIISGIRTLLWTTSSACWKRFCSQRISPINALDVSRRCALQIYILGPTYLLTYHEKLVVSTEFCENQLTSFCVILLTNERTKNKRRWKHNLLGGRKLQCSTVHSV